MRLVQFRAEDDMARVAVVDGQGGALQILREGATTYGLAKSAASQGRKLAEVVAEWSSEETADYDRIVADGRLLPPIHHGDPARWFVTGTGLTHLKGVSDRNAMHGEEADGDKRLSDAMEMYRWGLEGGKPPPGQAGVQSEWFFKGDGSCVVAPEQAFMMPDFALGGGEEPELVGLYVIGEDGVPYRVGFTLGNEFSDHALEQRNTLYLPHSKLRPCSFGPELLLGDPPAQVAGTTRILRDGKVVWEGEFATGEENMSHSVANLEHHHFKYRMFRRPGDLHTHFFGAAMLSFTTGFRTEPGDVFEIEAPPFGRPLRNRLEVASPPSTPVRVL